VNENRDRLPAVDVQAVEAAVTGVREAIKGDSLDAIRTATEGLQKASHAMAEQVYKAQGSGARDQGSGFRDQEGSKNDVVDGEVVDA
jgi:molecular chaperone DnaK